VALYSVVQPEAAMIFIIYPGGGGYFPIWTKKGMCGPKLKGKGMVSSHFGDKKGIGFGHMHFGLKYGSCTLVLNSIFSMEKATFVSIDRTLNKKQCLLVLTR